MDFIATSSLYDNISNNIDLSLEDILPPNIEKPKISEEIKEDIIDEVTPTVTLPKTLKYQFNYNKINNRKLKLLLDASTTFKGKAITDNKYLGKCVQGPQEWYAKIGINLGGWWHGHQKDLKAFTQDPNTSLNRAGFIPIAHMTLEQSRNLKPEDLRPGDIMLSTKGKYATAKSGYHGAMWDGVCWKSDTKQTQISGVNKLSGMGMPYNKTTAGDWAVVIYRNPQVQENDEQVVAWQGLNKSNTIDYLKTLKNGSLAYFNYS